MTCGLHGRSWVACSFIAGVLLQACAVQGQTYDNINAYLQASPAKFSILNGYLKKAGLTTMLSKKDLAVAFFAPTNSAFTQTIKKWLSGMDADGISTALLGHVADYPFAKACLRTGVTMNVLPPAQYPSTPRTLLADSDVGVVRALFSAAKITKGDIKTGKSLVHEVDTFLLFHRGSTPYYAIVDAAHKLGLKKFAAAIDTYEPRGNGDIWGVARTGIPGTAFGFTDETYDKFLQQCPNAAHVTMGSILAYSFSHNYLPLPRMLSKLRITTMQQNREDARGWTPSELQIVYLPGKTKPSIVADEGTYNVVKSVLTNGGVLHILDAPLVPIVGRSIC